MIRLILFLILCATSWLPLSAEEPREILAIREHYSETLKKIKTGSLYQRELNLAYPVIPGAGPAASRVRIYYDIPEGHDGEFEYGIVRVENYYQHAGRVFYEEYLFNPKGELMFYYGRRGSGDINRADGIYWNYDERFYFWGDTLVRTIYGQEMHDRPVAAEIKKGTIRLKQAQDIREKYCQVLFPAPLVFTGE